MLYRHVLLKISSEFRRISWVYLVYLNFVGLPGLPEFRGSAPALNIKSPATMSCVIYIIQTGDKKFASSDYISPVGRQKAT